MEQFHNFLGVGVVYTASDEMNGSEKATNTDTTRNQKQTYTLTSHLAEPADTEGFIAGGIVQSRSSEVGETTPRTRGVAGSHSNEEGDIRLGNDGTKDERFVFWPILASFNTGASRFRMTTNTELHEFCLS